MKAGRGSGQGRRERGTQLGWIGSETVPATWVGVALAGMGAGVYQTAVASPTAATVVTIMMAAGDGRDRRQTAVATRIVTAVATSEDARARFEAARTPTSGSTRVDSADRAVNAALRDAVQRAKRDAGQLPGAVRSAEELMASKELSGFGATFASKAFKMRGDLDGCLLFLSYLHRAGIPATEYHYNPAIAATARRKDWQKAMGLLKEMESKGITLNTGTYSSVITACEKSGRWEESLQLFESSGTPSPTTPSSRRARRAAGGRRRERDGVQGR